MKELKYNKAIDEICDLEISINKDPAIYHKRIILSVWYILANSNQGRSDHKNATKYYELCLLADPRNPELLFSSGISFLALNEVKKAQNNLIVLSKHHGVNNPLTNQLTQQIKEYRQNNEENFD